MTITAMHDMTLVMETTTADETITIPCQNSGAFSASIDWGDGTTSDITAYNDAGLTHRYAAAGDHTIRISGAFPNICFDDGGDKLKLKKISQLGTTGLTRLDRAFSGCTGLTDFDVGAFNIDGVTDMSYMFAVCRYPLMSQASALLDIHMIRPQLP